MTTMALIAVLGLAALIFVSFFFSARGSARRTGVHAEVEQEIAAKLRQAQEADAELLRNIVGGIPVDRALADHQKARAAIVTVDRPDRPWDWNKDDVETLRRRELQRRVEEVNRSTLLPAIVCCLLVLTVTGTVIVLMYNSLSPESATSGGKAPPGLNRLPASVPLPPVDAAPAPAPPDALPAGSTTKDAEPSGPAGDPNTPSSQNSVSDPLKEARS